MSIAWSLSEEIDLGCRLGQDLVHLLLQLSLQALDAHTLCSMPMGCSCSG